MGNVWVEGKIFYLGNLVEKCRGLSKFQINEKKGPVVEKGLMGRESPKIMVNQYWFSYRDPFC